MDRLPKFWTVVGGWLSSALRGLLLVLVGTYRSLGTTHFGGACRFEPSCSEYAAEAVRTLKPTTAIRLVTVRLLKCRPGGPYGFDPVPRSDKRSDVGESK